MPLESASENVGKEKRPQNVSEKKRQEEEAETPLSVGYFFTVCGICGLLVLAMVLSMVLILRGRRRKRRRRY